MKLTHFKELDGIRAIAALMVMFFHFFQGADGSGALFLLIKKYAIFGQTGVSLFFVLSGFLITRILLNTKQGPSYFKNFYLRRALRIFPLYYLFLIFFYFLIPVFEHSSFIPFNQQIYFWVYLQNIATTFNWPNNGPGHFWSLAIEEHFYLFWPLLIYFLDNKKIKIAIFFIIAVAAITRLLLIRYNYEVFYFTLSRMDELAVGALLAIWEVEGKLKPGNSRKFILMFCLIIIPTIALWVFTTGQGIDIIQISKFILLSFCYFSLIGLSITIKESNWIKKILKFNVLSYTGKISYGLYVYHPLCFWLLTKHFKINSLLVSFVLSFAFCYLIASISYYFFEAKFLKLKSKFDYNGKDAVLHLHPTAGGN